MVPSADRLRVSSQVVRRAAGSRPVGGSLRKRRSGLPTIPSPTLLAAGQRLDPGVGLIGQPDQFDHLGHRTGRRVEAGVALEDLADREEGLDGQLLERNPDPRAQPPLLVTLPGIHSENSHLPGVTAQEAFEDLDRCRLGGTVRTQECEHLTPLDGEGHVVDGAESTVGLAQTFHGHSGHRALFPNFAAPYTTSAPGTPPTRRAPSDSTWPRTRASDDHARRARVQNQFPSDVKRRALRRPGSRPTGCDGRGPATSSGTGSVTGSPSRTSSAP